MYSNPRTQRSIPSRLNAVGPTKKIGCALVRKKVRISGIPLSPRDPNTFVVTGLRFLAVGEPFCRGKSSHAADTGATGTVDLLRKKEDL